MKIKALRTRKLIPPKDNLWEVLEGILPKITERSILVVTSKIVSIGEGNCIRIDQIKDKDELVIKEAQKYIDRKLVPGEWVMLTMKNNLLIPTSGIDESNSNGYYTLWPKDPKTSAKEIWTFIQNKLKLNYFGVIITDSHTIPLRWGTIGISLSHFGFKPLLDYRGKKDLFGRILKISQLNIPDSLASAAVFTMGEGSEQTPFAIIQDLPEFIQFRKSEYNPKNWRKKFEIPLDLDIYKPFLTSVPWKKGGSS